MKIARTLCLAIVAIVATCSILFAQGDVKHFSKDGFSFDYPAGWAIKDVSDSDTQTLQLSREDADIQLTVSAHRGRITPEKMPDAHKAFIDPYVEGVAKQLTQMGRLERTPSTSEIGGVKADGVNLKVSVTGDSATSQIYYALDGERVVIISYFGPDNHRKKFVSTFDLIRTSIKIEEALKPTPRPSKTPQ
jgi:hypothetical protein